MPPEPYCGFGNLLIVNLVALAKSFHLHVPKNASLLVFAIGVFLKSVETHFPFFLFLFFLFSLSVAYFQHIVSFYFNYLDSWFPSLLTRSHLFLILQ